MASPLKHTAYIETVLKDVSLVLRALHEDQRIPIEQRARLSGCLDELTHAQLALQDDETCVHALLENMSISSGACSRRNSCGSRVKHHSETTRAAIVDYDTAWCGETFKVDWTDGQTGPDLWVHAKLYLMGNNEPLALVYRIDLRSSRTLKRARPKQCQKTPCLRL